MPLLEAMGLRKTFGDRTVVQGVSLAIEPAEIVGLLGRNGAGKTTTFRMIMGMIDVDAGQVALVSGGRKRDISKLPMYQRARLGMGYLSQEPSVFGRLTCEQNLMAILETQPLARKARKDRCDELLAQFELIHKRNEPARTCSGGERRKLEIARALVTNPAIILLDEPFSGVDPLAVEDLQQEIRRLTSMNIAILITDHNVQQTLAVCDRAYIIDEGKVLREGTPRDLINDDLVKRAYLGSMFRGDEFDRPAAKAPKARTRKASAQPASERTPEEAKP
ncbi:MAG: LPS export ABC transporter ATP-binding protein [Phycisphaerales bacterium]|nr:LPS export ABC transporter ATP-binding protein [Phycisphaerales bacterium]